jgi:DNA-damage-inducible protein J
MAMASTGFVRARIDEALKEEAAAVLAEFGLTVSDVVRMTLTRVAKDGAVPLELKVPNRETQAAMRESRRLMKKHNARFDNAKDMFHALDRQAGKR